MLCKENMASYKHLASPKFVSFNRCHWCVCKVGDVFIPTELFSNNNKSL